MNADQFKVVMIANDDHPMPDWLEQRFSDAGIVFEIRQCYNRADLEIYASDADILWFMSSRRGLATEDNMDIFKKACAIFKVGSGTDNIDHRAATKRGIIVAHTPDEPTEPTSDHFIAMLFTAVRQTARQDRLVRSGIWDVRAALPVGPLTSAELGIIGLGRIGKAIARKLSGFNMTIRAYDPYIQESDMSECNIIKTDLDNLLQTSRYVLITCPLCPTTENLIDIRELQLMRKDSVLVNVARAGIVNEDALLCALKNKWIKYAAFDVLKEHPIKENNELLKLENLILTPHMGGYPYDYPDGIFNTIVNEIIKVSEKQLPTWIVNKDVRPRWF